MGKTPARERPEYWNGNHKWVSIADLGKAGKFISETKEGLTDAGVSESGIKPVPRGTLMMSFKLSIGKVSIAAEELFTNEAIMAFIDRGRYEMDTGYLYHLFRGKNWNEGTNKAVLGLTLNKATLSKKSIPLPPLTTQRAIAFRLDKVCDLIAKRQAQLDRLDTLAKSLFVEMFGDPLQGTSKWPLVAIEELFDVGSSKRVFEKDWKSEGIPFYRAREIVKLAESGSVDNDLFISPDMYRTFKKNYGVPMPGDILVTGVGTLGVCYLVSDERPFYYKDGNIICLHSKGKISSRFVLECYRFPFIKDQIQRKAGGSTVGTYTITNAKKTQIILPPPEMQQAFVSRIEAIDKSKFAIRRWLSLFRDWLTK